MTGKQSEDRPLDEGTTDPGVGTDRRPYETPAITVWGDFENLTESGNGASPDTAGTHTSKGT